MSDQNAYIPGVCNINPKEIQRRKTAGYIGAGVFVVLLALLLLIDAPAYTRALLFLPAFVGAIGFLQAKNKFCVGYAAAGQHNANEGSETAKNIANEDNISRDKTRARQINWQAVGIAIIVTLPTIMFS